MPVACGEIDQERASPPAQANEAVADLLTQGEQHQRAGQLEQAQACLREVLQAQPDHAAARLQLGILLAERGRLDEALSHLREAVRLQPGDARAQYNLGVALAERGEVGEAADRFAEALRFQPDYAAAHYALGNVRGKQRRPADAADCYRRALACQPDYADAYNNLGLALLELRQPAEAAVVLRQNARLRPQSPEAHNNLGLALAELGCFAEAEAAYHDALRLKPNHAEAHSNLANAYKEQGRFAEALACYQIALWLEPEAASTHWNRSLAWLQMGDYERGWPEYEWRWRRPQTRPRPLRQPRWDGTPLAGRTVLLWMEQGLGDMIQFVRYAPLVRQRGGTVVVECPGSLAPLFATCPGIDRVVAEGAELPPFDVHAPLMSLPALLGTTLATVPADVPYLAAEPARVEHWRRRLGELPGFKVGIAWQGNPHHKWDRHRSVPLTAFEPLARLDGVHLVSLQKGPGTEQLRAVAGRFPVVEVDGLDATAAWADTAALMKSLDLVVTVDTAPAHLAGALGVPVWVALSALADWRWLRDRDDSPWYPTLRLFRQSRLGDWGRVFERMAAEVRRVRKAARRQREAACHSVRQWRWSPGLSRSGSPPPAKAGTPTQAQPDQEPGKVPARAAMPPAPPARRPRVSLCLIVKDEEANLPACLDAAADLADEIVVVDTGSTDATKAIAVRYGAQVHDFPWCDSFAAARNESLRHATGDWAFWLDADDRLDEENRRRLRALFDRLGDDNAAYVMKCVCLPGPERDSTTVVDHVRLFRNRPDVRWRYRVHEQILPAVRGVRADVRWSDVVIHHAGYQDPTLRRRKLERDLRLLQLDQAEQPDDPFVLFNLGSIYHELGRVEEALPLLRRSLERSNPADSIVRKLYALLAHGNRQRGRLTEALAHCQAGRVHYPDDVELLFVEGTTRHGLGDLAGAEACLRRLLEAPPGAYFASVDAGLRGYKARHNLAVVHLDQGRLAEAEAQWREVLREQPGFVPAVVGLGQIALAQGRADEVERLAGRMESELRSPREAAALRGRLARVERNVRGAANGCRAATGPAGE